VARIVKFAIFAVIAATVFGFVVMRLWNWLMPGLFALHPVTFWQALGLLILGKLLFGGFHGHSRGMGWRRRMRERWQHMTPEEREKFRAGMRHRCGSFGSAETEAKP
jgi:hypothetical protein